MKLGTGQTRAANQLQSPCRSRIVTMPARQVALTLSTLSALWKLSPHVRPLRLRSPTYVPRWKHASPKPALPQIGLQQKIPQCNYRTSRRSHNAIMRRNLQWHLRLQRRLQRLPVQITLYYPVNRNAFIQMLDVPTSPLPSTLSGQLPHVQPLRVHTTMCATR